MGSSNGAAGGKAVDDQIAALERELQGSDDSSSDEETSSSSTGEDDDDDDDDESSEEGNGAASSSSSRESRGQLKLASPLEAEKIEPLPAHLLPRPGCGVPKDKKKKKKPKKPKKPKSGAKGEGGGGGGGDTAAAAAAGPAPSQGLDSAVKELLANYEARSSERVPFYCRVCQFQGERCVCLCVC